jgi:hypothetical protein
MARRIVNRKEKRAEHEAYERTVGEEVEKEEEEEGDEEEGEESEEAEASDEAAEGDDEDAPKKKPKKAAAKPKAKAKPRTRTPKVVRMKVVWGVFNNSNQRVATYDYPKRKEADEHAERLKTDKKQTFFVQPVKEPFEEKKEA